MNTYLPITRKVRDLTGSRKREFGLSTTEHPMNVDSYWDGGSKSSYRVFNIDTGLEIYPQGNHPFGANGRMGYMLIAGDIMIETGTFCGKPATPRLTCRPEDLERVRQFLLA